MKKLFFTIGFLLFFFLAGAQNYKGYNVEATTRLEAKKAFVVGNDTMRNTTQLSVTDTVFVTKDYLAGYQNNHGIYSRAESTLSYNDGTRTITVTPTSSYWKYYFEGKGYNIQTISQSHANTTGTYYLYYNSSNVLTIASSPWSILTDVLIGGVYYNATMAEGILLDERHGYNRNRPAHLEMHELLGAYKVSGFGISGYTVQPVTPTDADNTFALTSGIIADEDIRHSLVELADNGPYKVMYKSGAAGEWMWESNNVPYTWGATYLEYNQWTGATWQLTQTAANNFLNLWVGKIGAAESQYQTLIIVDQDEHAVAADAEAQKLGDMDFSGFPIPEFAVIYKVTMQTGAAYSSTGKCRIYAVTEEVKTFGGTAGGAATATSHNALTGIDGGEAGYYGHLTQVEKNRLIAFRDSVRANEGQDLSGSGATLSGYTLALTKDATPVTLPNEADGSITNEGQLTVAAGTATTSIINSNTSGQTGVTLTVDGTNLGISETGNNITVSNLKPDQTVSLANGTGISSTGTYPNFTITNTAPNVTTDLSITGTVSPLTLNSSDGTDVTITAGTGVSLTGTSGNVTITNSSPDTYAAVTKGNLTENITGLEFDATRQVIGGAAQLSLTTGYGIPTTTQLGNIHASGSDNQTLTIGGTTSPTIALSGSNTATFVASTGITLGQATGTITVTNSAPNVTTDLAVSGVSSPLTITSSDGTDITVTAGTGITLAGAAGGLTITNSAPNVTDAANLTFTGAASPYTLNSSTGTDVTFSQGTGVTITRATNDLSFGLTSNTISGKTLGSNLDALTISSPLSGTSYNGSAPISIGLSAGYGDTQNPYASKTANYFLAAPNGSAGAPTFRAIVAADIPALSYELPLTFSTGLNRTGNTITSTITQYTDALARSAISLTTTGSSGEATYTSATGVLNIPQYAPATGSGNYIQNQNSSAQTANMWISGTGIFQGNLTTYGNFDLTGKLLLRAGQIQSNVAQGTAPLTVASTTVVANLNADLLDGYDFEDFVGGDRKSWTSVVGDDGNDGWYPIFSFNDTQGPVHCVIRALYYTSLSFTVSKGYLAQTPIITILNANTGSTNGSFKYIKGIRLLDGVVEIKLHGAGATTSIAAQLYGSGVGVVFNSTLTRNSGAPTVLDVVDPIVSGSMRTNGQFYAGSSLVWNAGNSNLGTVAWNAASYSINGTNINTANTLTNVAYKGTLTTNYIPKYGVNQLENSPISSDGSSTVTINGAQTYFQNGSNTVFFGANINAITLTANTTKTARYLTPNYTQASYASPFLWAVSESNATDNKLTLGGGSANGFASTFISFNTAANTATATGTERMRITSAGNVGIGTTSPNYKLDVIGNVAIKNEAIDTPLRFYGQAEGGWQYISHTTGATRKAYWGMYINGNFGITKENGGYIELSGANVGIGDTNPAEKLTVAGKTKTTTFQMTTGAADGYYLKSDASGNGTWTEIEQPDNDGVQTLSGTTVTWNADNGLNAKITLTGATTITLSNLVAGKHGTLSVVNGGNVEFRITFAGYTIKVHDAIRHTANKVGVSGGTVSDEFTWYYNGDYVAIRGGLNLW